MADMVFSGVTFSGGYSISLPPPSYSAYAIFGYGQLQGGTNTSVTNLVSNTGVVATDTTGVGTIRQQLAAAGYGSDKAIFGYGYTGNPSFILYSLTNLVSNTGVVASNTTGIGTARLALAAASFGSA